MTATNTREESVSLMCDFVLILRAVTNYVDLKINKGTRNCIILDLLSVGFVIPYSFKKTKLEARIPAVDILPLFLGTLLSQSV